jgi:hypothetical protein
LINRRSHYDQKFTFLKGNTRLPLPFSDATTGLIRHSGWTSPPTSIYHISMVFYTDTNGNLPSDRSTALIMLGITMETFPLNDIGIDNFNNIAPLIDFGAFEEE